VYSPNNGINLFLTSSVLHGRSTHVMGLLHQRKVDNFYATLAHMAAV